MLRCHRKIIKSPVIGVFLQLEYTVWSADNICTRSENRYTYQCFTTFSCMRVGLAPTFCFRLMYKQNLDLVNLFNPVITAMGYELWGVEYIPKGKGSLLRIYIDNESGITLDDCARVSDQVAGVLDVNDPIRGRYDLEVSSPGMDRPLFTLEQFERYRGSEVRLRLRTKLDGRRNFNGRIDEVRDGMVRIIDEGNIYSIPGEDIDKANIKQ